jgi:hypothetical protein
MKSELLTTMLDGQKGIRKDGNSYVLDESVHATFFVGGTVEVMSVPRVVRVELGKEICTLSTARRERFLFPVDALLGVKIEEATDTPKSSGGAGFR